MKLSTILNETASVAVPFGDEKLNVVYRPGVYTPEFESRIEVAGEQKDADSLSAMLNGLLESWDLVDDDNKPVATDTKTLRALPVKLLAGVLKAIVKDFSPNKSASDATGNG